MSQPTPYTPTTDFSQQESINASGRSTVNTAALDAELANIDTTLDQTLANLTLLQRDDGRLKDLVVDVHTLTPEVLNLIGGLSMRGLWAPHTDYYAKDLCSNGLYTYTCKITHTSGPVFDSEKWSQFGFTSGADAAAAAAAAFSSAGDAESASSSAAASANSASLSAVAASTQASNAASSAALATTRAAEASASAVSSANSAAFASSLVIGASGIPVGTVIQFCSATPPTGYLALPTAPANISRSAYSILFAAIGTTWGAGDGSTTFGMPYCPSGHALLAGVVGVATAGQVLSHTHAFGIAEGGNVVGNGVTAGISSGTGAGLVNPVIGATGGPANLPAGVGVKFCIKY